MSAGPHHTLALNSTGSLYAWGNGRQGKLGLSNTMSIDTPTKLFAQEKFGEVVSIFNF